MKRDVTALNRIRKAKNDKIDFYVQIIMFAFVFALFFSNIYFIDQIKQAFESLNIKTSQNFLNQNIQLFFNNITSYSVLINFIFCFIFLNSIFFSFLFIVFYCSGKTVFFCNSLYDLTNKIFRQGTNYTRFVPCYISQSKFLC